MPMTQTWLPAARASSAAAMTPKEEVEADMDQIAACIALAMEDGFEGNVEKLRGMVESICQKYPLYQ